MPEDMSEYMPDRIPDRMPEDISEYMPEDMPDRMPDRMPEDMSEYMPENMSDRMPEDLPDRMPEDMPEDIPDRMPENIYINIIMYFSHFLSISNLFQPEVRSSLPLLRPIFSVHTYRSCSSSVFTAFSAYIFIIKPLTSNIFFNLISKILSISIFIQLKIYYN